MSDKPKILIIEDDEDVIAAMRLALEKEGYSILSIVSAEIGFQKAKDEKPDLIILDVMFGLDEEAMGFDYAVKMKQDKGLASIPILMITAVNMRYPDLKFSARTDGEYLPVDDFIDKPAKPDILRLKVKKLLTQKISKWVNWPEPPK